MSRFLSVMVSSLAVVLSTLHARAQDAEAASAGLRWLVYPAAGEGVGKGRHVVLIAAEQEYRSEEALPMLARILSTRHGFDCTVLFCLKDGLVDPTQKIRGQDKDATVTHDIPGLELLRKADLMVVFHRLLSLPEQQLQEMVSYFDSGRPIFAIRTANHGFRGPIPYRIDGQPVRFGEDLLGGAFRNHHGGWHREATRGIVAPGAEEHPVLRGVEDVFGPSDVYRTYPEGGALPGDCRALLLGQPLVGLEHSDPPNEAKEALPVVWVKHWKTSSGRMARVFHSTMGSARDLRSAGLRRTFLNGMLWCLGLEESITSGLSVDLVGTYEPRASGFAYDKLDVKPRPVEFFR
jgi:hypothetical protein